MEQTIYQNGQKNLHSIEEHKDGEITSSRSISVTAYQDIPFENLHLHSEYGALGKKKKNEFISEGNNTNNTVKT